MSEDSAKTSDIETAAIDWYRARRPQNLDDAEPYPIEHMGLKYTADFNLAKAVRALLQSDRHRP